MALQFSPIAGYGSTVLAFTRMYISRLGFQEIAVKRQHGFRSYPRNCFFIWTQVTSRKRSPPITTSTGVYHEKSSKRDIKQGRNLAFAGGNKYIEDATDAKVENKTESGQTEDPSVTGSDSFSSGPPITAADENLKPQATTLNTLARDGQRGGNISSLSAAHGIEAGDGSTSNAITAPASSTVSSSVRGIEYPSIPGQQGSFTSGTSSLSAREKLRTARNLTGFAESGQIRKPLPGKDILDALRESEKEGKTTKYGEPIKPSNLLDDQKRGLPEKGKIFDFNLGPNQLSIIASFLLISTIMFGTTYIVWKVGAIHFNEY